MKVFTAGITAAMLMASPAFADGFDWSGLYIGAHGGWAQDKFDPSTSLLPDESAAGPEVEGLLDDKLIDGWTGGAQIGINRQFGVLVVGLEADISGGDVEGENNLSLFGGALKASVKSDLELFGTARARLGYLVRDNLLIYGTGGLAWGKFDTSVDASFGPITANFSGDTTQVGWTVGAGAEWALNDRWSITGSYLYADLGDEDISVNGPISNGVNSISLGLPMHVEHELHFVRTGLNFRF